MSDVTFPTPEEFSDWRRANPTRGRARDLHHCPLAECLRDRGALKPAVCSHWSDESDRGLNWPETPQWAQDWYLAYDAGREINPPVPAKADVKPGMRQVDGEWAYSAAWL